MGYASNIAVLYKLVVVDNKVLAPEFSSLTVFTIFGILVSVPTAIVLGLFHVRRTGAYAADASLSVESNPYTYKLIPGKEREVLVPLMILTARGLAKVLEKQDSLDPREKAQFDRVLSKAATLMQGGTIGLTKQRDVSETLS